MAAEANRRLTYSADVDQCIPSSAKRYVVIFWDVVNVRVPLPLTVKHVTQGLRAMFVEDGYVEYDFYAVCDCKHESQSLLSALSDEEITILHADSTSKSSTDSKLCSLMRRTSLKLKSGDKLVLLADDNNFSAEVCAIRLETLVTVLLIHTEYASNGLLSVANEHCLLSRFLNVGAYGTNIGQSLLNECGEKMRLHATAPQNSSEFEHGLFDKTDLSSDDERLTTSLVEAKYASKDGAVVDLLRMVPAGDDSIYASYTTSLSSSAAGLKGRGRAKCDSSKTVASSEACKEWGHSALYQITISGLTTTLPTSILEQSIRACISERMPSATIEYFVLGYNKMKNAFVGRVALKNFSDALSAMQCLQASSSLSAKTTNNYDCRESSQQQLRLQLERVRCKCSATENLLATQKRRIAGDLPNNFACLSAAGDERHIPAAKLDPALPRSIKNGSNQTKFIDHATQQQKLHAARNSSESVSSLGAPGPEQPPKKDRIDAAKLLTKKTQKSVVDKKQSINLPSKTLKPASNSVKSSIVPKTTKAVKNIDAKNLPPVAVVLPVHSKNRQPKKFQLLPYPLLKHFKLWLETEFSRQNLLCPEQTINRQSLQQTFSSDSHRVELFQLHSAKAIDKVIMYQCRDLVTRTTGALTRVTYRLKTVTKTAALTADGVQLETLMSNSWKWLSRLQQRLFSILEQQPKRSMTLSELVKRWCSYAKHKREYSITTMQQMEFILRRYYTDTVEMKQLSPGGASSKAGDENSMNNVIVILLANARQLPTSKPKTSFAKSKPNKKTKTKKESPKTKCDAIVDAAKTNNTVVPNTTKASHSAQPVVVNEEQKPANKSASSRLLKSPRKAAKRAESLFSEKLSEKYLIDNADYICHCIYSYLYHAYEVQGQFVTIRQLYQIWPLIRDDVQYDFKSARHLVHVIRHQFGHAFTFYGGGEEEKRYDLDRTLIIIKTFNDNPWQLEALATLQTPKMCLNMPFIHFK